jgi:signal transduction histidine kinase
LSQAALTAGLAAGGLSLLLAFLLAFNLLRPVRELTQAAARLGQGDLAQRVPVRGNDELTILGRSFNKMADSLQAATRSRQALTADIAHELRNPLAVQRANLEALQDGVYPLTPENLQPILEQNMLLSRLVDDLHTLALADAGQLKLERIPVDLRLLVERVGERFRPQASSQKITLNQHVPADALAAEAGPLLDPLRIEQILSNLFSNALRYTPEGGQIEISLVFRPDLAEMTVRDSGPGIPAEALPYIFDRFYRADRSRSRMDGGTGLGLAIARQLAEAHGGSLTAANHPQGGAVFTLRLPLQI